MQFRVGIEATEPYLQVCASGPASLTELCALAAFVGELCARGDHCTLLADVTQVEPDLSFTDHLQFANVVVGLLKKLKAIAAVVPPGYLDAPAARAAKLAGLNLATFLDRTQAQAWIDSNPSLRKR